MIEISQSQQIAMLTRMVLKLSDRVQLLEAQQVRRDPPKGPPKRSPAVRMVRETMLPLVAKAAPLHGVQEASIMSEDRSRPVAQARQWVMFEAHAVGLSTAEIGRFLGRDHTTVMHGIRAEAARREVDQA